MMNRNQRDYIILLVLQISAHLNVNVFYHLMPNKSAEGISLVIHIITLIAVNIFLLKITANFYKSRWVRTTYAAMIIAQFLLNSYVNVPNRPVSTTLWVGSISYLLSFLCFSFIFYLLLKDIFLKRHHISYSLLGASNLYLFIPTIFGFLYSIIGLHDPVAYFHLAPNAPIIDLINTCFLYSFYITSGIDYPGPPVHFAINNLGVLQALISNIFLVFIVGRLMANEIPTVLKKKKKKKKTEESIKS